MGFVPGMTSQSGSMWFQANYDANGVYYVVVPAL